MIEFYPQIKAFHIAFVVASVMLFAGRGGLVLAGSRWGMVAPVRYLSYAIDTALLTSALMLLTILPGALLARIRPAPPWRSGQSGHARRSPAGSGGRPPDAAGLRRDRGAQAHAVHDVVPQHSGRPRTDAVQGLNGRRAQLQ